MWRDRSSRHTRRPSIPRLRGSAPAHGLPQSGPRRRDAMVDWEGIERSAEFRELVKRRRRFVVPATIFFLAYYMTFIIVAGYAPDFMGESVYQGLTVGYCYALTQFLMVFVLGLWYLRKADREFDPLSDAAVEAAADSD